MNILAYQAAVMEMSIYPEAGTGSKDALAYAVLGLNGESGEVAEVLKKIMRSRLACTYDTMSLESRLRLIEELGDALWYIVAIAVELHVTMEDVMLYNYLKLYARSPKGQVPWIISNRREDEVGELVMGLEENFSQLLNTGDNDDDNK